MSFREKTAWAMAIILIGAGGFYFNMVAQASAALGDVSPPVTGFVIAYVTVVVIASVVAMIVLGIANRDEANAPVDERETLALHKAGHVSSYVLAVAVFVGMMHYATNANGNALFHITFGGLMLSQIGEYVLQIIYFRRGV